MCFTSDCPVQGVLIQAEEIKIYSSAFNKLRVTQEGILARMQFRRNL